MKRSILSITLAVMFVAGMTFAIGIPKQMNYQGILSGSTGNPLVDSTVDVEFRIYNVPAGGNSVWAETLSVTTDNQGRLNVTLGLINPIEDTVFRQPGRYLSLNVESDGELPRIKLVSMGYSNRVSTVDGSKGGSVTGEIVVVGSGPDDVLVLGVNDPNIALELRSGTFGGNPFIDFVNDAAEDNDARIQLNGEKGLVISVDSSLTIPTGNVGIGTTAPQAPLHVHDASGDEVARFQAPPATAAPYISLWYNTFEGARIQTVNDVSSGGSLRFFTKNSFGIFERMRISAFGQVGIGTTSPVQALHVSQNGSNTAVMIDDPTSRCRLGMISGSADNSEFGYKTNLVIGTITDNTFAGFSEKIRITGAGNVGIGTTSPAQKLHVAGNARINDTLFASNVSSLSPLRLQTAGTTRMYIDDATGKVGVGTIAPLEQLHVVGNVLVSGNLTKAYTVGTSDMAAPLAYANINSDGTVASGTPNVTSVWDVINERFEITIAGESYTGTGYVTIVTPLVSAAPDALFATTGSGSGLLRVRIMSSATGTTGLARAFQFVTYKP